MLDHAANFFRITLHATIYFLFRYIFFLYRQRNEHVVFVARTYLYATAYFRLRCFIVVVRFDIFVYFSRDINTIRQKTTRG